MTEWTSEPVQINDIQFKPEVGIYYGRYQCFMLKCADLKDVVILRAFADAKDGLSLDDISALFPDLMIPRNMVRAKLRTLYRRKFLNIGITELGLIELARLEGRVLEHRPHISQGKSPPRLGAATDAAIEMYRQIRGR